MEARLTSLGNSLEQIERGGELSCPMAMLLVGEPWPWIRTYFWVTGDFLSGMAPLGLSGGEAVHLAVRNLGIVPVFLAVRLRLREGVLAFSNGGQTLDREEEFCAVPSPLGVVVYLEMPILLVGHRVWKRVREQGEVLDILDISITAIRGGHEARTSLVIRLG